MLKNTNIGVPNYAKTKIIELVKKNASLQIGIGKIPKSLHHKKRALDNCQQNQMIATRILSSIQR